MAKPYDWEEIKHVLLKELKKTKHILTFGTIGSLNVEHDIDIITTKKPDSKSSSYFRELHKILDSVDGYLMKKYKSKLIRGPHHSYLPEFTKLSKSLMNLSSLNLKQSSIALWVKEIISSRIIALL